MMEVTPVLPWGLLILAVIGVAVLVGGIVVVAVVGMGRSSGNPNHPANFACPDCGTELVTGAAACFKCGAKLS